MTQEIKSSKAPQNTITPTEPVCCPGCGTLLVLYSAGSTANLLLHCSNCGYDYNIDLQEEWITIRRIIDDAASSDCSSIQQAAGPHCEEDT